MVKNKISFDPNILFIWTGHTLSIVSGSAPANSDSERGSSSGSGSRSLSWDVYPIHSSMASILARKRWTTARRREFIVRVIYSLTPELAFFCLTWINELMNYVHQSGMKSVNYIDRFKFRVWFAPSLIKKPSTTIILIISNLDLMHHVQ
jgi:hypothetical protein